MGLFSAAKGSTEQTTEVRADSWREMERRMATEREAERKRRNREEEEKLARIVAEDEAERLAARDFIPNVRVEKYKSGAFLCYETTELPVRFIASITVKTPGHAPEKRFMPSYGYGPDFLAEKYEGRIDITMIGGSVHSIKCSRWHVDALLDALLTAWRRAR
jgi:hypothetical protein